MKNLAKLSLVLFGLITMFSSCEDRLSPSGYVTFQEREVTNFDGLDVSAACDVDVSFTTGEERVEIEADDNLQARIVVDKSGSTLRIRIQNGTNISGNATLRAHILTPTPMRYLAASGATRIKLYNQLETDVLFVELSGASSLEGAVSVPDMDAVLTGASILTLEGNIQKFNGHAEGASIIDDFNLECNDLNLNLSGASNAKLTVNGTIDLDASGSSTLSYKGYPTIRHLNLSGSARLVDSN